MTDHTLDIALGALSLNDDTNSDSLHPRFSSDQGDLILVSSDGVKFKFEKAKLANKSGVFADMFEIGEAGEGVDEVPVAESGTVIELVLDYCDGHPIPLPLESGMLYGELIRVSDKCEMDLGTKLEAMMSRRRRAWHEARQVLWRKKIGSLYHGLKRNGLPPDALAWIYDAWLGASKVRTVRDLGLYAQQLDPKPDPRCFFPANALRKVLRELLAEVV